MIETKVIGGEIAEEEKQAYIEHCVKKFGSNIELIEIELDGDYVNLRVHTKNQPFQRIRRITGYLVGTLDRFNDAKKDEVNHRVKHLSKKDWNREDD